MPIHCRECGRSNQDEREFCFSCGAFLEWAGERVERAHARIDAVPPGQPSEAPRETVRRLSLDLSPPRVAVVPGERQSVLVTVRNLGSTVEGAELHLTGLPAAWWTFDPPRVALMPSTEARATLSIHPPRLTTSKSGDYPVAVDVSSQLDRKASADAVVTVESFVQLSAQLKPENSRGRGSGTHQVCVANASNSRLATRIEAVDNDDALRFQPQASDLMIEPGESMTTAMRVRPRRRQWLRRRPAQRFSVRVSAPGTARVDRPATFTQLPLLPGWALPATAVGAAVALILGVVVLGHKAGPPKVRIQSARAASPAIAATVAPRRPKSSTPTTAVPVAAVSQAATATPSGQPAQPAPAAPISAAPTIGRTATSTTTPRLVKLRGVVRWPDKSAAAGVNIVIYPHGYDPSNPAHLASTSNIATAVGGAYTTKICNKTPCDNVQAFLELPINTVFPDGCTLPLTTLSARPTGFATSGGNVDWTISDGTCTADPSGKPIDDPNIPAYTTEYVEQRINTVGGGTVDSSPVSTTTTTLP